MSEDHPAYQAYLLRLWRVREARDVWRVSLEDPHTRELRGFGSLEEAFRFLNALVELPSATDETLQLQVESGTGTG